MGQIEREKERKVGRKVRKENSDRGRMKGNQKG
jgi:hypothetical protein